MRDFREALASKMESQRVPRKETCKYVCSRLYQTYNIYVWKHVNMRFIALEKDVRNLSIAEHRKAKEYQILKLSSSKVSTPIFIALFCKVQMEMLGFQKTHCALVKNSMLLSTQPTLSMILNLCPGSSGGMAEERVNVAMNATRTSRTCSRASIDLIAS